MKPRWNSLFWRFFAAIFITNILVMSVTTYIAIEASEEILGDEHHKQLTLNTVAFLVEKYEQLPKKHRDRLRIPRHRLDEDHPPRLGKLKHRLAIYDANKKKIFGKLDNEHDDYIELYYQSPNSQKRYRAISRPPKLPRHISHILGMVQSIRFVLLLLASAIVSFLLSLLITRPLKRLGIYTEQLAHGELQTSVSDNLLTRGDEIGDLARQLNAMGIELDKLINNKQQLLHDVSHELRAPLTRLQASNALLNEGPYTDRINNECERMSALIQEILDLARIESDLKKEHFSLSALIEQCIHDIQFEYPNHPIDYKQATSPILFNGNADKLHSAIENLLRNACKHTAEETKVVMELIEQRDNWLIRIRDYGSGVNDAELDKLCQPFYRGNNRMHGDGFGLGLSIAQRAIELHAGKLIPSNPPNGGLQIDVLLPKQ